MIPSPAPSLWDRATRLGLRVVDGLVLAGMGLCVLVDVYVLVDIYPQGGGTRTTLRLVASLVSFGAVALRRRFPLGSFAVVIAVMVSLLLLRTSGGPYAGYDYPLLAPVAALGAMITTLVRRLPTNQAIGCAVTGTGAMVLLLSWPMTAQERLLLSVTFGGIYAVGLGAGIYLRGLERRSQLAAEAVRRDERLDLARELHDLVAHHVTGIVVQAQAAQVVADRDPDAAAAALERIEGAGREALNAMRRLVGSLRDDEDELGAAPTAPPVGLAGLADLVAVGDGTGLAVQLQVDDEARAVPTTVAASAHRIVQESLTNARRHAVGATSAVVDLRVDGPDLVVTITDDGRPPLDSRSDRPGYGLLGMTERAHALGGRLAAGPVAPPAHGWSVQAHLPLDGGGP